MPTFSFVIPVLNEGDGLSATLASLHDDFPGAQRIIVDGGSHDDTVPLALRGAHSVLLSPPGRALQMNLGAAAATGDYLCFLHADTKPCFTEECLSAQLDPAKQWGFCSIRLRSERISLRIVAAFMRLRSRKTGVATGDQMLIVKRSLFESVGGFAQIPLMEDVDICKRLRVLADPQSLSLVVTSSARRWERHGVVRTVMRMWLLRLAYWLGVSPQRLWHHYYGIRPRSDTPADCGANADADPARSR